MLEEKWGVSAAAPAAMMAVPGMAMAGGGEAAAADEGPSSFDAILAEIDADGV